MGNAVLGVAAAQQATPGLDTERGLIDGYVAVAAWPAQPAAPDSPRDPRGFTVHLGSLSDPSIERVNAAGDWFLPPEDKYRVWIEGEGLISRPVLLNFGLRKAEPGEHGMRRLFSLQPAGRVALSAAVRLTPAQSLRLLAVPGGFARRVSAEAAPKGALMPEGEVIAATFDGAKMEYMAVSRPVPVAAGTVNAVRPAPPPHPLSDLVVHAALEGAAFRSAGPTTLVAVLGDGSQRPADVLVDDLNHLYGIWYGLDSRTVAVTLVSKALGCDPIDALLPAGGVRSLEMRCKRLPNLAVTLGLPPGFPSQGLRLQVTRPGEIVTERLLRPDERKILIEALPLGLLELALVAPPWRPTLHVDLRNGNDQEIDFHVDTIEIDGRVELCDSKEPARIRFQADHDQWAEFGTDTDGTFKAVVFQPVMLYQLIPDGRSSAFVEVLPVPIDHDSTLDIAQPCNDYRICVRDGRTDEPLPGALVSVRNERADESGASSRSLASDENGLVRLPPLRAGLLRATASAEGYESSSVEVEVPTHTVRREIELRLWPEEHTATLRVLLPGGRPAAGAGVSLASLLTGSVVWEGHCDGSGKAKLPDRPQATHLAVRHEGAGFSIVAWPLRTSAHPATVALPLTRSVTLAVRNADGGPESAGITLWVEGIRVSGSLLAWLTQCPAMSDSAGLWRPRGLPAAELGVLAWRRGRGLERVVEAGQLDSMRSILRATESQVVSLVAVQ